jgi:methylated-DNA-protein-cysteine methyltransferase-like protein
MTSFRSFPDKNLFNLAVWEVVRRIPRGKVATYGQIARLVPVPEGVEESTYRAFGPRWVGGAMAGCPSGIPWQRVVNAQGKISVRKGSGQDRQRALLLEEGVLFGTNNRIDLKRFGWDPEE